MGNDTREVVLPNGSRLETSGTVQVSVSPTKHYSKLPTEFHVLPMEQPMILGHSFLKKYQAKIDLINRILIVHENSKEVTFTTKEPLLQRSVAQ